MDQRGEKSYENIHISSSQPREVVRVGRLKCRILPLPTKMTLEIMSSQHPNSYILKDVFMDEKYSESANELEGWCLKYRT